MGEGKIRAVEKFLMSPHPLTSFEIQKYYQNELKLNGVYSRNNLSKIKGGAYMKNLNEYESNGTHWIAFYVNDNNVTYVDSFGVRHIPKEIKKLIGNKNVITNIYRIQAYDYVRILYCWIYWFYVKR